LEELEPVLSASAAAIAVLMLCIWLASLRLRDASIVDLFWGPGFALVAWVGFAVGNGAAPRQWLTALLTSVWGLRLAAHLFARNRGRVEDRRYRAMRERHGACFGWISLATVFGFQGLMMWIVSLPLHQAQAQPAPARLTPWDALGVGVFALGFAFEAVGDWQLARFKRDAANRDRVMDRGLWAWTRHPNYFGDALLWWGLFLLACSTPGGEYTAIGPALMTTLLWRVSGVALLEPDLRARKPGFAEYAARTSAFFPRPPRERGV
jgi:steroid 5-alpha reductase family enzyme